VKLNYWTVGGASVLGNEPVIQSNLTQNFSAMQQAGIANIDIQGVP
jgi:hypothetical protein